jgi:hypothetical protein
MSGINKSIVFAFSFIIIVFHCSKINNLILNIKLYLLIIYVYIYLMKQVYSVKFLMFHVM